MFTRQEVALFRSKHPHFAVLPLNEKDRPRFAALAHCCAAASAYSLLVSINMKEYQDMHSAKVRRSSACIVSRYFPSAEQRGYLNGRQAFERLLFQTLSASLRPGGLTVFPLIPFDLLRLFAVFIQDTMRSNTLSLLAAASALAAATPVIQDDFYGLGGLQEQLPIADVPPETRTRVVTETETFFEVVETVYMTKPELVPTWVPTPKVEENTCDETKEIGCAICRTIHQCTDIEEEWCASYPRWPVQVYDADHS